MKQKITIAVVLVAFAIAFAGCGNAEKTPAELEPHYSVSEGLSVQETIQGIEFDVRLPRVEHSMNLEIERFYDGQISWHERFFRKSHNGDYDLSEWEREMTLRPVISYSVREAKGLISVQIRESNTIQGLVFDPDGAIYDKQALLAVYGMTEEEALQAIMSTVNGGSGYAEIFDCNIYDEQTLYCTANAGGDLGHGYLLTKQDGVVTAAPLGEE